MATTGSEDTVTPQQTSIHLALGEAGTLDYAMVKRAVEAAVREDDRLDWKQAPYQGDKAKEEFAKDVAALANARGGIIVIGVAEERGTGAAATIHPFKAVDDGLERTMRSWLHNTVSPAVSGVGFHPLPADEGGTDGVLVVSVPPSPETPHMVGSDRSIGFPNRVGTQTMWMREPDIERSYRQRFDRRVSDEEHLDLLIDRAARHWDTSQDAWIAIATRPMVLRSASLPRPNREDIVEIFNGTTRHRADMKVNERETNAVVSTLSDAALNPRAGLRSWMAAYRPGGEPADRAKYAYASIHDDGSLVLAIQTANWGSDPVAGTCPVREGDIAGIAVDLVACVAAAAERFGIQGEHLARVRLIRANEDPLVYYAPHRVGSMTLSTNPVSWSLSVETFEPVDAIIPALVDVEVMRESVDDLARQAVSQFGVSDVHIWD